MGDWVLYTALATSIAGLMLLTFVSESLEPPYSAVAEINPGFIGKSVHLRGEVSDLYEFKGGSVLVTLSGGNSSIDIFLPYSVSTQIAFKPAINQALDVIGVVEVYKGRLEVVVGRESDIRLIEDES